ncbi:MAG: hypothetical protein KC492_14270 [Myxococcales bacterium]|nr:hypothetical protein [Myxococcales bacterium]
MFPILRVRRVCEPETREGLGWPPALRERAGASAILAISAGGRFIARERNGRTSLLQVFGPSSGGERRIAEIYEEVAVFDVHPGAERALLAVDHELGRVVCEVDLVNGHWIRTVDAAWAAYLGEQRLLVASPAGGHLVHRLEIVERGVVVACLPWGYGRVLLATRDGARFFTADASLECLWAYGVDGDSIRMIGEWDLGDYRSLRMHERDGRVYVVVHRWDAERCVYEISDDVGLPPPQAFSFDEACDALSFFPVPDHVAGYGASYPLAVRCSLAEIGVSLETSDGAPQVMICVFDEARRELVIEVVPRATLEETVALSLERVNGSECSMQIPDENYDAWVSIASRIWDQIGEALPVAREPADTRHTPSHSTCTARVVDGQRVSLAIPGAIAFGCAFTLRA